jgi:hypothetical protein
MRSFLTTILIILLVILVVVLAIGLVLLWAMGWGWLLARFSPLSLFEASLLIMLPSLLIVNRIASFFGDILTSFEPSSSSSEDRYELDEVDDYFNDEEIYPIPLKQLTKGKEPLGEDVVMLEFANGIYNRLTEEGKVGFMGDAQVRQLAIRLAEFAVKILKNKRGGGYRISLTAVKKQMEKDGQRPYDTDILNLAVEEVNELLASDEDVIMVTRSKSWRVLY